MSNLKDFATSLVATAPSPATSGTSLVLRAGDGTIFSTLTTPFYITAAPANAMPESGPNVNNAEKIQVTNVSTDTLTIVRAQGGTTAQSIATGWRISNTVFTDDISPMHNVKSFGAVGDGTTDDTTAIQAALTAAATAGGGKVFVPEATYKVSNLTIDSYVELEGAGRGTILQAISGSTGYMIALTTPATSQRIAVRNICLQPNTGTMGGIQLDNTGFGTAIDPIHVLENVVVLNAGGDAFHFDNSMRELKVMGCYAHYTGGYGYYIGAGCTDSRFLSNTVGPSTSHGFYILGNNNNFVACKSFWAGYNGITWGTTACGFYLSNAEYCTFSNNSSQQSALHGFYLSGMKYSAFTGNEADTNSAGTTGGVGIYTSYCTYSSVVGNSGANNGILSPGAQAYGIAVDGTQTELLLYGNTVQGTSGEFQYVSGYGYMLISGTIADLTGINTKINSVSQFGLLGSTSGTITVAVPATAGTHTLTLQAITGTAYVSSGTDVAVTDGGTGRGTATTAYGLIAAGTAATGVQQTVSPGTTGQILKSNGASALATFQTGAPGDVGLGNVDNTSDATKLAAALAAVYPVGCIYTSTVSTNPATVFGFGTWAAYGAGQVLVGKAASGTFATAGATGGEETHLLTTPEIPAHAHAGLGDGNLVAGGAGGSAANLAQTGSAFRVFNSTANTGGGGAHNNLQPYIVVYIWNRTA